ncbi:hypothetical protein BJF90_30750 [Pseudonocardia sp. CNS-004]|nr:hypothetical protein BJF90_30750 [Pseudonocardia sp. CNS-004]
MLGEVQRTQLDQDAADREMARQRTRFLVKAGIGAVVVGVLIVVGAPLLQITAVTSYAAFMVRGALNLYRTAYSQQIRVMVESILERGQFDPNTIDVLIAKTRKYAVLSGAGPARLQRLDAITDAFRTEVGRIAEEWDAVVRGGAGTAAQIQEVRDRALAAFSVMLDRVGVYSGTQYQSYPSISADSGLMGRTVNAGLAATYVIHFFWHVSQALATGGLDFWVNAVYAITDVLFFAQAGPAVITGFAGRDVASHHPAVRRIIHLLGLPIITVANALLTVQLVLAANLVLVGPAVALTLATAYLTKLGLAVELGLGRIAPRKGAWANTYLNAGLLAFGVLGLLPANWPVVVLGLAGGAAVVLGLSKIDTWRSTRARGPPVPRPQRNATEADLARIRSEAIVNPDGRGVVLVPPGDALRAHALELRVADGEVVLVMHGDRDGFSYPTADADVHVTPAQVAELLEQLLPTPARSGPLTVCACSLAAGPATAARELAGRTGRTVVASSSTVRVHRPGRAGARVTTDGGWLEFDATGPSRAAFPPTTLLDPKAVPGAQRLGPPGMRLPIAPRAPPATAAAGSGSDAAAGAVDGDLLITPEQRAYATERAAVHGGETLQKSRKQRRGYASYQS